MGSGTTVAEHHILTHLIEPLAWLAENLWKMPAVPPEHIWEVPYTDMKKLPQTMALLVPLKQIYSFFFELALISKQHYFSNIVNMLA